MMKTFIILMSVCFAPSLQLTDTDRYVSCESCLIAAQEIETALQETPAESRETVVEDLLFGSVCKKLRSFQHRHVSKDKLFSSCIKLMDTNYDKFQEALMTKEPKNLKILLCYETSTTCIGVKRKSFEDTKMEFKDSDIDNLLKANKDKVRIVQPVRPPAEAKDEL